MRRLQQLESFKHIYAPISGVITRRNTDVGALITAGSAGTGKELFDVAQVDPLRVFVSVPQSNAGSIRAGLPAYIELSEHPGQKFTGKVVRTADAIDPATRTLLTEIDVRTLTDICCRDLMLKSISLFRSRSRACRFP